MLAVGTPHELKEVPGVTPAGTRWLEIIGKDNAALMERLRGRRGVFDAPFSGEVYFLDVVACNHGAAGGIVTNRKGELLGILGRELRNTLTDTWINYAIPIQAKALVTPPVAAAAAAAGNQEVLRLAEEQLNVGKRMFETGTTRIRRFVTERPVEAEVKLHEEHAEVLRRAISDPNYIADIDWSDKEYSVTETAEEAVVSKSARVVEEVAIRKEGTDRVETVRDTVRRQQVEVEKVDPTKKRAS